MSKIRRMYTKAGQCRTNPWPAVPDWPWQNDRIVILAEPLWTTSKLQSTNLTYGASFRTTFQPIELWYRYLSKFLSYPTHSELGCNLSGFDDPTELSCTSTGLLWWIQDLIKFQKVEYGSIKCAKPMNNSKKLQISVNNKLFRTVPQRVAKKLTWAYFRSGATSTSTARMSERERAGGCCLALFLLRLEEELLLVVVLLLLLLLELELERDLDRELLLLRLSSSSLLFFLDFFLLFLDFLDFFFFFFFFLSLSA